MIWYKNGICFMYKKDQKITIVTDNVWSDFFWCMYNIWKNLVCGLLYGFFVMPLCSIPEAMGKDCFLTGIWMLYGMLVYIQQIFLALVEKIDFTINILTHSSLMVLAYFPKAMCFHRRHYVLSLFFSDLIKIEAIKVPYCCHFDFFIYAILIFIHQLILKTSEMYNILEVAKFTVYLPSS